MTFLPCPLTEEELRFYLATEKNAYVDFIGQKQSLQTCSMLLKKPTELHHIIPLHAKGPDVAWNLVRLSKSDHQRAHELLSKVYQSPCDLCALRFRQKHYRVAYQLRIQLSHFSQRVNQNGFWNSQTQSLNGKKGGSVKEEKKRLTYRQKVSDAWKPILNSQSLWYYKKTGFFMEIPAFSCFLPADVALTLLSYPAFGLSYTAKPQSLASSLSRVVNQKRKSASGWVLMKTN